MTALSDHLFWDVDRSGIDPERHAAWLAKRVLEYGRWRDWQILVEHFGKPELAKLVTGLRSLEPRAFAFCCAWFQLPPSSFRCSASMPSTSRDLGCGDCDPLRATTGVDQGAYVGAQK